VSRRKRHRAPVKVTYADGRTELRKPGSFEESAM
jgi:hypothetical protein